METKYTWMKREQLEQMTPETLLQQYQSLVEFIREKRGIPFERNPPRSRNELIELIQTGQISYGQDILMETLASQLHEYGKTHPGILFEIESSQCKGECNKRSCE